MAQQIDRSFRSPNFSSRDGRQITMIVLHATVGSARSALAWLTNPAARVSSHYVVDKAGAVYELVADEYTAWHAGRAGWKGESAINELSIGIEIENANDGRDPYPPAQLAALAELVGEKVRRYQIAPDMVVRHLDVALPKGRKSDPAGFPMASFLAQIFPDGAPPAEQPRPVPPSGLASPLAEALLAEAYRQAGAPGQQTWGLAQAAAKLGLGMAVAPAFDLTAGGRSYSAQSFGRDTLVCTMGDWRQPRRLSELRGAADAPLREALLAAIYQQAGETYHPDWAMHQEAARLSVGPPLDKGARLNVGGQVYVAACYALDVLYSPVGQWGTVSRMSGLPERGGLAPLREALYARWCARVGVPARREWVLQQEALRSGLGAPLGPSFRVSVGGHDYAAEAFALDVLATQIGSWSEITRLSELLQATPALAH